MSDTEKKTVRAKALREFSDAGSETTYAKDQEINVTEGTFANYEAAGLIAKVADAPAKGAPRG